MSDYAEAQVRALHAERGYVERANPDDPRLAEIDEQIAYWAPAAAEAVPVEPVPGPMSRARKTAAKKDE